MNGVCLCVRDVSMLELMMKQHQELKAKMDGRSKTIQQCADLGKILLAAGNPASEEVSRCGRDRCALALTP